MGASVAERNKGDWISVRETARRAGMGYWKVQQMVKIGAIGTQSLPGLKPLVSWPDLQRLIEAGTKPAKVI